MLGVKIEDLKIQWNSRAILTPAERCTKRLLGSFGAYERAVWRNSIRRASRPGQRSTPGEPPLHHGTLSTGQGFKGTIFYAVDMAKKEVACGPILLNGTTSIVAAGGRPLPQVLEEGGSTVILSGPRRARKKRAAVFRARPSKMAALEKTVQKKLPDLIAGGIMREV